MFLNNAGEMSVCLFQKEAESLTNLKSHTKVRMRFFLINQYDIPK